jgi:glutamate/aspartate transport system substrate-binding protein
VRKNSGIRSVADLANKRVVTTAGSTADRLIKTAALASNVSMNYMVGASHAESMAMLLHGEADAYVADDAILAAQRAASPEPAAFVLLAGNLSVEPYGIMLRRDDPSFKKVVDEAMIATYRSGAINPIYEKWFLKPIPPKNINLNVPISDAFKKVIASPTDSGDPAVY